MFVLVNFVIEFVLYLLALAVHPIIILAYLYMVAVLVPGFAVASRRLHDLRSPRRGRTRTSRRGHRARLGGPEGEAAGPPRRAEGPPAPTAWTQRLAARSRVRQVGGLPDHLE
jgi:hypothetical protein